MSAIAQRNFAGGELAPANYSRTDQIKYATGVRTLRNMFIKRSGGVSNRPGTDFGNEVKDSTKTVRLIEFVQDDVNGVVYVVEFGDLYIRIWKENALVLNAGVPYELVSPYTAADLPAITFVQSNDTLTLTHASYATRELKRISETNWSLTPVTFAPSIAAPAAVAAPVGTVGGRNLGYAVTAIGPDGIEESLATYSASVVALACTEANPVDLTWNEVTGAIGYSIYRATFPTGGLWPPNYKPSYTWIGTSLGGAFRDPGAAENPLKTPPITRIAFDATNKYPSAVAYYQQRRVLANSNTSPETVSASRTGRGWNFTTSFPIQDDDAVTFTLVGRRANAIKHMLDLGRLILFTAHEEKMVEGDNAGILRPDAINPRKLSANGIGTLRPLEIDDSAVYVQARATKVRDFKPVSADSYEGTDLTVFASHLFEGYTIVDWAYAQNPHSIVWAVRSDGVLLGLTYLREHAIWGWHRHDTDGTIENVCVVPEGSEDRVYLVVKRTINGLTKRYVERLASRFFVDQEDASFLDCAKSYNGWNTGATTVTLSGGSSWDETELLTATASAATFAAGDVGNQVFFSYTDADGVERILRLTISGFTSGTVVTGHADKTVPASLRALALTDWALAKKTMSGLSHLEGKAVSVLGDGYVVASPNNADYSAVVVTVGVVTLPAPYAVIRVGLPFISDVVTLDLDAPGPSTIKDRKVLVSRLGLYLEATRGVFAGMPDQPTADDPLNGLEELKIREDEDYGEITSPVTDYVEINTDANWNTNGRMMVRQVDPLPITVLAIMPIGYLPA